MQLAPESETSPQSVPQYTQAPEMQVPNRDPLLLRDATRPKALDLDSSIPNIILFGETGVGKSSIINMLRGEVVAPISNRAYGCTPETSYHEVTLAGPSGEKKYRFWDTSGLDESDKGTVPAQKAIANLAVLIRELGVNDSSAGGVSLLVYCIRGTRLEEIVRVNYDLFWGIICNRQVPIVLVITGLENEDDMESWWWDNRAELEDSMGMKFKDHACVTSTKGKLDKSGQYIFEDEYQESVRKVRELVESSCAWHPVPLRTEGERWMADMERRIRRYKSEYNHRTGQERYALEGSDNLNMRDHAKFLQRFLGYIYNVWCHLVELAFMNNQQEAEFHYSQSAPHRTEYTYRSRDEQLATTDPLGQPSTHDRRELHCNSAINQLEHAEH